jgi:hypothetical protein
LESAKQAQMMQKHQKLLEANPSNSLAHYRIAEILFLHGK